MQVLKLPRWANWFGPAFLILVFAGFFITPGTVLDKFNWVCFGI